MIEFPSVSSEKVEMVNWMQKQCIESYLTVAATLKTGMTEGNIANSIRAELKKLGVTDFWYDIPVMVLIGEGRFRQMTCNNYVIKSPLETVVLQENQPIFIDMHPRHKSGHWGNLAATGLYRPRDNNEAVTFLQEMQKIQRKGVAHLTPTMLCSDVYGLFKKRFDQENIELTDIRGNFGHSMEFGEKLMSRRVFLDSNTHTPIGGRIFGIEPGGLRSTSGGILVARFETCVHIPQTGTGSVKMLGNTSVLPVVFNNR